MASKRVTRRDFLQMCGMLGGMAVLAACAPSAPTATKAPSEAGQVSTAQVTITLWNADWGKDFNDPMIKLNDAFIKDVMPNAKIETTFMPTVSEKLAAAVAGGNPPDVAMLDEGYGIPKMARAGGLNSVKEYFDRDGVKASDFIPFTWETVLYKGVPYAIPGGAGAVLIMYDKAVFKEVGIDPASMPETPKWDQFVEWNNKLIKRDSSGKIVRIGLSPDTWLFNQWAGVLGATYYNADKTKVTLNSPETVAAVEKWTSLLPQDVPYDDISKLLSGAPTSTYGAWGAGLQGMVCDGYWAFLALDKYWPKIDYGMSRLPTPNGSKDEWKLYTGWVWDMCIPKGSKHPNEAWAFMKYGYWDHGQMLADTLNWTSCLKCTDEFIKRTEAIMGANNRELPYLPVFKDAQYTANYFVPWTPIYQKMMDGLGQAIDAVNRRQKKAQQALDELVATLQPELDKANSQG